MTIYVNPSNTITARLRYTKEEHVFTIARSSLIAVGVIGFPGKDKASSVSFLLNPAIKSHDSSLLPSRKRFLRLTLSSRIVSKPAKCASVSELFDILRVSSDVFLEIPDNSSSTIFTSLSRSQLTSVRF